jgi:phage pi2 protein 07
MSSKLDVSTQKGMATTTQAKQENGTNNPSLTQQQNRWSRKPNNVIKEPKFEGRIEALNGNVYEYSYKQADTYTKTTKEIAEYIGQTFKYRNDALLAVLFLNAPTFEIPPDPPTGASKSEQRMWEKKIDEFVKRESIYNENMKSAYSVVWGQCTDALRAKLEANDNHATIALEGDAIGLLKNIRDAAFNFQSEKYKSHALQEAKRQFYQIYQKRSMTCQTYLEKFGSHVEYIEHCGGSIVDDIMMT